MKKSSEFGRSTARNDDDVPAELVDAAGDLHPRSLAESTRGASTKLERHAAHAGFRAGLQFFVRHAAGGRWRRSRALPFDERQASSIALLFTP